MFPKNISLLNWNRKCIISIDWYWFRINTLSFYRRNVKVWRALGLICPHTKQERVRARKKGRIQARASTYPVQKDWSSRHCGSSPAVLSWQSVKVECLTKCSRWISSISKYCIFLKINNVLKFHVFHDVNLHNYVGTSYK